MDFYNITNFNEIKEFHNIASLANISSILEHGLLCHDLAQKINHLDISLNEVQIRRNKSVPGGLALHKYVNLYFHARNPMLYLRKDEKIFVLRIDKCVADFDNVVFSDINAACEFALFKGKEYINDFDFSNIFAKYWVDINGNVIKDIKQKKNAEILVPRRIDASYIIGAYVKNEEDKEEVIDKGFNKEIIVSKEMFFMRG